MASGALFNEEEEEEEDDDDEDEDEDEDDEAEGVENKDDSTMRFEALRRGMVLASVSLQIVMRGISS